MSSDPDPRYGVRFEFTQRPIVITDSNSNDIAFILKPAESERGVRRIRAPKVIIFDREALRVHRQFLV
jgi:hypothetical protein